MFIKPRMRLAPDNTTFRFMNGRIAGLVVSAILSTASVILFFTPGLNLGIDFSGGIVMEVRTEGPPISRKSARRCRENISPNKECNGSATTPPC
jgi:preprotein translocase subunit SecF